MTTTQSSSPSTSSSPSPLPTSPPSEPDLPTYQDVLHASQTLQNIAHRTPILTSRTLDAQLGVRVFFKCENLQRMGAFKFRGAYTAVKRCLDDDDDDDNDNDTSNNRGNIRILTYSSGNHAQAIALAATSLLGVPSTIIMPRDAPPLKIEATRSYGGDVVFYDRYTEERDAVAERVKAELSQTHGDSPKVVFVPPYDHRYVIAGQGTVGKEFIEDLTRFLPHEHPHDHDHDHDAPSDSPSASPAEPIALDYLFVCVGGGGLLSGVSLSARALSPRTKLIGVEPLAGNDAQRSLRDDRIVRIPTPNTIADGAQTQHLGELTFRIMRRCVERIVTVTDEELVEEMRFFGERMKMVVEPTGCLGLAGLRKMVESGEVEKGSCCGVVISGGNVDLERYCRLISKS